MNGLASDPVTHQAVKRLLLTALDLPDHARAVWLAELERSTGIEVAAEVRRLLDAHAHVGTFLDVPEGGIEAPEQPAAVEGDRVGPFVIEREIGRGGMGTVYLAVREDGGFAQHVALKVIARDVDGRAAARLRDERRILASLSHPFIAHFIDGGTSDNGLPYIAMEYVEGRAITRYSDEADLDITARLRLALKVCGAVDFAHQHLVVHRDIKPTNILVTEDGMPKLLDFGIARLTEPGRDTAPTVAVMTPAYASPEQAEGGQITTATDVYALGVLLFELLTGTGPYRTVTPDTAPLKVLDAVRGELPEPPSSAARRAQRSPVDDDLDAVVLKALSKSPADRYRSAGELAQDIARYLDGQPVLAQPPSRAYRLRKFTARNRAAVAAAAIAVASLVAATAISLWQARIASDERARAEARFEDVRQLASAVLFELDEAVRSVPGTTAVRRLLMSRGLKYLEELSHDVRDELPLQRELAAGYQRIGDVQGNPFFPNLGERRAAMASYERALAMRQQIAARADAEPADHLALSASLTAMGDLLWADGSFEDARAYYQRAADTVEPLLAMEPGNPERAMAAGRAAYRLGQALTKLGRFRQARAEYERSHATLTAGPSPGPPANLRLAALAALKVGDCRLREGDPDGAHREYAHAAESLAALGPVASDLPDLRRLLLFVEHRDARVDAVSGRIELAYARMVELIGTLEQLAAADPDDRQIQGDIAAAASTLGGIEIVRARPDEARRLLTRSRTLFEALASTGAGYADLKSEHGTALRRLGDLDASEGRLESALQWYAQAMSIADGPPRDLEYAPERILLYLTSARVSRAASTRRGGADTNADRWRAEGIAEWQRVSADGVRVWIEAFGSPTVLKDLAASTQP